MHNDTNDWANDEKSAINYWRKAIDDSDDPVDWAWVNALDLNQGIESHDTDIQSALREDYDTRARIENIMRTLSKTWMFDRDGVIPDYGLVLALAHASRRLNDAIDYRISCLPEEDVPEDSMEKGTWHSNNRHSGQQSYDWHDRYLPGRNVNTVVGIDLETTGLNQYRDYVIDSGYEYMDMKSDAVIDNGCSYLASGYTSSGAYHQERHSYGLSHLRSQMGNPTEFLTGISAADLSGLVPLDDDEHAQSVLLKTLQSAPFVAHNSSFEHKHFMANVRGYAEAYRNGEITIIDTLSMSRKWGHEGTMKDDNNKLDTYAKNWDGLDAKSHERHLGLEDSHIMLLAMKHHLRYLEKRSEGPWGDGGDEGIGGKTCR